MKKVIDTRRSSGRTNSVCPKRAASNIRVRPIEGNNHGRYSDYDEFDPEYLRANQCRPKGQGLLRDQFLEDGVLIATASWDGISVSKVPSLR